MGPWQPQLTAAASAQEPQPALGAANVSLPAHMQAGPFCSRMVLPINMGILALHCEELPWPRSMSCCQADCNCTVLQQ